MNATVCDPAGQTPIFIVIILLPELEYTYQHHHKFMPVFFKEPVCKRHCKDELLVNVSLDHKKKTAEGM
jgi:hypothetical protein